jgi:membrane peptidoglycan carboxypeptidase
MSKKKKRFHQKNFIKSTLGEIKNDFNDQQNKLMINETNNTEKEKIDNGQVITPIQNNDETNQEQYQIDINMAPNTKQKKKKNWKKIFSWILYVGVIIALIGGILFSAFVAYISKDLPATDGLINRVVPETTKIYNADGSTVLYELHGEEKRTSIELEYLPSYVYNAVVSIEDKDFYNHKGLVPRRVLKAVYVDVINIVWKIFTGKAKTFYQGASTITQQLVKNSILTNEFSITRKLKEMILAWQLEKKFDKQQILKMYLNEIPFGSVYYGIETAAQNYLGKSTKDLSIAEAAILAAIIQRPSYFSPFGSHVDELLNRQQLVLSLMLDQGYINQEEYDIAKNDEIIFKSKNDQKIIAPHFVMYTIDYINELLGDDYSEQLLRDGGLKIYTTIDLNLQKIAEKTIGDNIENIELQGGDNASLVSINPKNGHILVMVGSRDYFDNDHNGQYNVAVALRQPGSSIKPLVYLSAFEKGYYPETVIYDVVTDFNGYKPNNYNYKEYGAVTMRKALQGSLNISAVKTLYLSGLNYVLNIAKKFGYSTLNDPDRFGLTFVLGGAEVKLLEHTSAFATFANDGLYIKTSPISKIIDRQGNIIYENKGLGEQVIRQDSVRMLNSVLSDDASRQFIFGANSALYLPGRQVAAKTGTTNNNKDGWTMGYTPSIATGVWVGRNDNKEMTGPKADAVYVAGPIWKEFMQKALEGKPVEYFPAPPHNNSSKAVLNGSILKGITLKINKVSGKIASDFTPPEYVEEKTFREVHSILHYCDKDNPNGPYPTNPANDPFYGRWEAAIQAWLVKYNEKANANPNDDLQPIDVTTPPTETDDNVYTPENKPNLTIIEPQNNQIINDNKLKISVQATAPRGISKYEYFFDNKIIPSNNSNYIEYPLYDESLGDHKIKVKVSDDVGNSTEQEITITLSNSSYPVEINIVYPQNNNTYPITAFPLVFTADILGANQIQKSQFCYQNIEYSSINCFDINEAFLNGSNTFKWNIPPSTTGSYKYYLNLTTTNGNVQTEARLIILR